MGFDEDFSAERFQALDQEDPAPVHGLIIRLQEEVGAEIHRVVAEKMAEIVVELNRMGHRLVLETDDVGEISYHDDTDPPDGAHCWLRLAADTTISAGWLGIWSGSLDEECES